MKPEANEHEQKLVYLLFKWREEEAFAIQANNESYANEISAYRKELEGTLTSCGIEIPEFVEGECIHYKDQLYILAQNVVTHPETLESVSDSLSLDSAMLYKTYYLDIHSVLIEERQITIELLKVILTALNNCSFVSMIKRIHSNLSPTGLSTAGGYDLDKLKSMVEKAIG